MTTENRYGLYDFIGLSNNLEQSCVQEALELKEITDKDTIAKYMGINDPSLLEITFPKSDTGTFYVSEFDGHYAILYEINSTF